MYKRQDDVRADLERVAASGVCEVLVLAGEVRFDSPKRRAWHAMMVDACEAALELDLLPHTNVGPLLEAEMAALAEVNASMGLMLEQATPALRLPGAPHHRAPSKDPALRMEQLDMAGRLRVPFTTGILCGIGETADDRLRSLDVIAESHARHGHVQECIIQPFSPDPALARFAPGAAPDLPALVAAARARLPAGVVVQVPPNLVKGELERCLRSGARDLGGISPVDHVNRSHDFPGVDELAATVARAGLTLEERLPLHDEFLPWLRPRVADVYRRRWAPEARRAAA